MAADDRFKELNPRTCAVLGGRGYIGRSLVLKLLKLGHWIVRIADGADSLQLDSSDCDSVLSEAISSGRASYFHVDVRHRLSVLQAIQGSSVVFYMDPTNLNTDDFYSCYMVIVQGAKNVINACRECKVRRLIYNSSADVVFDGFHDVYNGDELLACPWKIDNMLNDLKAQAEALILFANDINGLLTCALRPSNVFGPGDSEFMSFLVKLAISGWAKFIIGNGENMSDFTLSENVVHAHICAEEALNVQVASVAGKAFFITNLAPMKFWEFVSRILEGMGCRRPVVKLPAKMVWNIFMLIKWTHKKLQLGNFNHFLLGHYIQVSSCTKTFNCTAAQKFIGYSPIISLEEGIKLTVQSFSHLATDLSFARYSQFTEPSKAEKLLGNGKVAAILLWRDERVTFTCFVALVILFYCFFLCGGTFTSSAANLLLLNTMFLYGYGILSSDIFGLQFQKISSSSFEISDVLVKDSLLSLACTWNKSFRCIKALAQGGDWCPFLKVVFSLYVLKVILSKSLTVTVASAIVFAFTGFYVYEQYEWEIDGLVQLFRSSVKECMIHLVKNIPNSISSLCHNQDDHQAKRPGGLKNVRLGR